MVKIAPSILSADFRNLGEQVRLLEKGKADWLHLDVMDGHFVPNITFGPMVVKAIRSLTKLPLDTHLMIKQPERYIEEFANAGSTRITVHVETCAHLHRTVQRIRELGCKPGVTLNPATPVSTLEEILPFVDLVLVMTVNPGFGGQDYIEAGTGKIRRVRQLLTQRGSAAALEVDGGITLKTIRPAWEAGADTFVAGTAVFGEADPARAIVRLKEACQTAV